MDVPDVAGAAAAGAAPPGEGVRRGTELQPDDVALIRAADTFFLGTANPERGADASHRGGAATDRRVGECGSIERPAARIPRRGTPAG
ncbi:MAG TPA: hypothetical protein VGD29_22365 [Actinoplanes sp.]